MTVLGFRGPTGTRRCSAECYEAKSPKCVCICEGMNHGKGYEIAVDNSIALAPRWLKGSEFTEILEEGVFAQPSVVDAVREAPAQCTACGGSGLIDGLICPNCQGSG